MCSMFLLARVLFKILIGKQSYMKYIQEMLSDSRFSENFYNCRRATMAVLKYNTMDGLSFLNLFLSPIRF